MFGINRAKVLPIGLDIGRDSIKMLQLCVTSQGGISVVAAAKQAIPEAARSDAHTHLAAACDLIRGMLRGGAFVGRSVISAIPREILHVKNLRLPAMPAAELEGAVAFESRNVLPFDVENAQVRFIPAGDVRMGADVRQEVIVIAAMNDDVAHYVEQLHRCGLVLESLDVELCALYRAAERFITRRDEEQDVHVVLDVGHRRSQVVIGRGREISFYKPIEIGGEHFLRAVTQKLRITAPEAAALRRRLSDVNEDPGRKDPVRQTVHDALRPLAEELARELSLCLRYYSVTFRGSRPSRIKLAGGEACDTLVHALLASHLPVPVDVFNPLAAIDATRMRAADRVGPGCDWTLAVGLALRTTHQYFAGRNSQSISSASDSASSAVVIDLDRAVRDSGTGSGVWKQNAPAAAPTEAGAQEARNA